MRGMASRQRPLQGFGAHRPIRSRAWERCENHAPFCVRRHCTGAPDWENIPSTTQGAGADRVGVGPRGFDPELNGFRFQSIAFRLLGEPGGLIEHQ